MKAKLLSKLRNTYDIKWNRNAKRWYVKHKDTGYLHRWMSLRNALIFSVHDCQGESVSDNWFWKWKHTIKFRTL